ncbi:MAG: response regulator [Deltaproteobacteria bacterium]|nr:response regulator [Deltaproteobacteria bacterium]
MRLSSSKDSATDAIEVFTPDELLGIGTGEDILVVDDNELNLIAVEAALAPLGKRLVLVQSGVEALSRLLDGDFALIILDVAMPGMSGLETAALIRARERNRSTPIIFITGLSGQDQVVLDGYEVGGFDFLVKPVRPEILRAKVRVFLQLQERTRQLQQKVLDLRGSQEQVVEQEVEAKRQQLEATLLEQRLNELADLDRRKDDFLAILGHELRNPLQALHMAVEVLRVQRDEQTTARVHRLIEHRVRDLGRLVEDLLDVSRSATGLYREPVSLHYVIGQALDNCRASLGARSLEVDASTPEAFVIGDSVRLVQIFAHLLENAIKHTADNGTIKIAVSADEVVLISVIDDGRGIPAELLPRVFDSFVRERASKDGAGGLGLRLALVKRMVELHGGSIRAASAGDGLGSRFDIELPRAPQPPRQVVSDAARPTGLRIVVCDDAADIRELVAATLREEGHVVTVAATGEAAIRAIVDEQPDAAFLDLALPDLDGFAVAREVRARLGTNAPRLVAVSGYGEASDRSTAIEAGFDAHLVKPTTLRQLVDALPTEPRPRPGQ